MSQGASGGEQPQQVMWLPPEDVVDDDVSEDEDDAMLQDLLGTNRELCYRCNCWGNVVSLTNRPDVGGGYTDGGASEAATANASADGGGDGETERRLNYHFPVSTTLHFRCRMCGYRRTTVDFPAKRATGRPVTFTITVPSARASSSSAATSGTGTDTDVSAAQEARQRHADRLQLTVLASELCELEIPECGLTISSGTHRGRHTTIGLLLEETIANLQENLGSAGGGGEELIEETDEDEDDDDAAGDAALIAAATGGEGAVAEPETPQTLGGVIRELRRFLRGRRSFTLRLYDPSGCTCVDTASAACDRLDAQTAAAADGDAAYADDDAVDDADARAERERVKAAVLADVGVVRVFAVDGGFSDADKSVLHTRDWLLPGEERVVDAAAAAAEAQSAAMAAAVAAAKAQQGEK